MKKRRKESESYRYEVDIHDWSVKVYFNEYADLNLFGCEQYEERLILELFGELSSASSKKMKGKKHVCVVLFPSDFWYKEVKQSSLFEKEVEDDGSIGNIEVIKEYRSDRDNKDLVMFRISIPTKSYETILGYLSANKGNGSVSIVGTDIFRKKGKAMYFGYRGKV